MQPTTPQLRLHTEETTQRPEFEEFQSLGKITDSLTDSIGWRFAYRPSVDEQTDGWDRQRKTGRVIVESALSGQGEPKTSHRNAERIAESLTSVLDELDRTRHAVWQLEAELAAGVPVAARQDEANHLARRLEGALQAGATAIDCDAAAMYILDDATTTLKMRSQWGLPPEKLIAPPRELRGAMADLEALMGHAVALEDANDPLPWSSPEPDFGSALCVPISTPSTPLGTLWLFATEARPFGERDTNIAEIVAGRVAAELEREMLMTRASAAENVQRQIEMAGEWFTQRLPQIKPLAPQWQFAGQRLDDSPGGEFFDWSVLSDGRLACAVADCPGLNINTLLNSAAFKAIYQSHASHRHSASSLLRRVNETLWSSSPGDAMASLFYALIDEDTGVMEYASAGDPIAVAFRDSKYRSLASGGIPLGVDPDMAIEGRKRRIAPDETLIMLTESTRHVTLKNGKLLDEPMLARAARNWQHLDAEPLCEKISAWLRDETDEPAMPKACVLVVKRRADNSQ